MELSILLGKVMGFYLLVMSVALLYNRSYFEGMLSDVVKNKAFMLYGGAIALVVGLFLVLTHNIWSTDWRILVTLMGWAALIKGLMLIAFPGYMVKMTKRMVDCSCIQVSGVVMFLASVYLLYASFVLVAA